MTRLPVVQAAATKAADEAASKLQDTHARGQKEAAQLREDLRREAEVERGIADAAWALAKVCAMLHSKPWPNWPQVVRAVAGVQQQTCVHLQLPGSNQGACLHVNLPMPGARKAHLAHARVCMQAETQQAWLQALHEVQQRSLEQQSTLQRKHAQVSLLLLSAAMNKQRSTKQSKLSWCTLSTSRLTACTEVCSSASQQVSVEGP